ncbi:MAG: NAD(P)H-dependent oxidoreductase subunit E [Bacteroidales bacterium]
MSIQEIIRQFDPGQDNLLNILHALQNTHPQNYLTEEALEETARYLKMTKAAVFGVAGYYSMFSLRPRGKHVIRICISPVCEIMKAHDMIPFIEEVLGIKTGATTRDGLFTLETAECLGQCHEAPSMMIDDKVFNNLNEEKIQAIITNIRSQKS